MCVWYHKTNGILCINGWMNGWRRKETEKEGEWKSKNFENPTFSFTLKSWAFHLNCVITNDVWLNSFKYPYHCWFPSVRSFLPVYVRLVKVFRLNHSYSFPLKWTKIEECECRRIIVWYLFYNTIAPNATVSMYTQVERVCFGIQQVRLWIKFWQTLHNEFGN